MDTSMTNSAYAKNSGDGLLCSILCLHPVQIKAKSFCISHYLNFVDSYELYLCGYLSVGQLNNGK
jgi:hypothetical protein